MVNEGMIFPSSELLHDSRQSVIHDGSLIHRRSIPVIQWQQHRQLDEHYGNTASFEGRTPLDRVNTKPLA